MWKNLENVQLTSLRVASSLLLINHNSQSISIAGIEDCEFRDVIFLASKTIFFLSVSQAR